MSHNDSQAIRLDDPEIAAEYLNTAFSVGDQDAFLKALRDVAKARQGGVSGLARDISTNRSALTTTLSKGGNPQLRRLTAVLAASGLALTVRPARKLGAAAAKQLKSK